MAEFVDNVSIDGVEVIRETDRAVLVTIEDEQMWIPKSQIDERSEVWDNSKDGRGPGTLMISQWIANQKGLLT